MSDETIAMSAGAPVGESSTEKSPGAGGYFLRLLLLAIPVINVVAALLWGFVSSRPETRRFGRGALLYLVIITLLALLAGILGYFQLRGLLASL